MAATVSPWGKPGAWALDSEEHEAELQQQQHDQLISQIPSEPLADFPSLAAAATSKPKKKKGQTISLAEFTTYGAPKPAPSSQQPKGLTPDELMSLPTGPRQRSAEELEQDRSRGGGFRSYGSSNREDSSSRWGSSSRGSDEPRRGGSFNRDRDSSRDSAPSRADEIDNWAAGKKSTVGNNSFERREREGRSGGFFDSQSRADDSDSWVSSKTFVPSSEGRRFSNGGGFERERKVGLFGSNGGADSDNWGKNKKEESSVGVGGGGGSERPRLNLQRRTLPVTVSDVKQEGKQEGMGTETEMGTGAVAKPKGSNPFGEARPREEVLAEKGQDWKQIEEKLDAVKIEEKAESASFGKRSFGIGNGSVAENRTERSWRKPDTAEARPQSAESAEQIENGVGEEK